LNRNRYAVVHLGRGRRKKLIPYARLRPGRGFRAGRVGLYYAQRLAVGPWLRQSIARTIASLIRLGQSTDSWEPVERQYANVVSTLHQQGICTMPGFVTEDKANSILKYLLGQDVLLADGRLMPTERLPPDTKMAVYPLQTLTKNREVLRLINAAPVLRIAADYLGCKPTLSGLGAYWSFPENGSAGGTRNLGIPPVIDRLIYTQHFHRDVDDWRFVKLFVYLTDVDHGSGPHAYVMQSHRTVAHFRARQYSRRVIDSRYGRDRMRTVLGPRGTAFMADTYGIHAGMVPTLTPRLILQAQYSLLPVFAFHYEPVEAEDTSDLDDYVTRLILRR
jgi:hypothetical protein